MNLARFRALMRAVTGRLSQMVRRLLRRHGVPVTVAQRTALAKALHPHIARARVQAHDAGTRRLAAQARSAKVSVPPAALRQYPVASVVTTLENATRVDDPGPRSRAMVTVSSSDDAPERRRGRVSVRDPESDAPRRGRAKVSVRLLDEQTRKARRATVEITEANRRDPQVVRVVTEKVEAAVERHVRMAAREAVTDAVAALDAARERAKAAAAERNADAIAARENLGTREPSPTQPNSGGREPDPPPGKQIGWARVLTGGENCAFCAMLAARGPVYTTKQAALFVGVGVDKYHDHCDCETVLVVEGRDWVGREQYENLEQLWMESKAGTSGNESVKAFATAWNQKVAGEEIDAYIADEHLDVARPGVTAGPLSTPGRGRRDVSRGLSTIERVHALSLTTVDIRSADDPLAPPSVAQGSANAVYTNSSLFVRLDGPHVESTLIHEYGHHVDHVLGGGNGQMLSMSADRPPEMAAVMDAIEASAPVRALREGIGAEGALPADEMAQRTYLLLRPELFARAYAQWVAVESRSVRVQRAIERSVAASGADQHRQWTREEFAPIRAAMSELMAVHWTP